MIEYAYLPDPLRVNTSATLRANVLFLYGFSGADPCAIAVSIQDANTNTRVAAVMANYYTPASNFARYLAALYAITDSGYVGAVSSVPTATLATAAEYTARVNTYLDACRAYLRAVNPGKTDAELFGGTNGEIAFLKWTATLPNGTVKNFSAAQIANRIAACLAEYNTRTGATVVTPTPTPTPAPTPTPTPTPTPVPTSTPTLAEQAANAVARWRAVLSDARRLETDATNIGAALTGVLQAWQAAGNYPEQVRTLTGLVQDASANVDYARQLAAALATVIQVGETIAATGTGTLPGNPTVPPPPALPTVIPARPDGTIPVVEATSVPSDPAALEKEAAPVVKPAGMSAGKILLLALSLLSLFS